MKKRILTLSVFFIIATLHYSFAQKPIVQTLYTADPAPMVYNDRMYLYSGHDEDASTWFSMNDWRLYSTDDMVNWTDHGVVLSYKTFEWAVGDAWASQCIEKDGRFYFYVTLTSRQNNRPALGVAVANNPDGPFYDPLGKPLVQTDRGDIDPTAFIDDDGQAYVYWGNPHCSYIKLNEDMISYQGDVVSVPLTTESFAKRDGDNSRATLYEEGPWLYKRNGLYYLFWAGGPIPEHLGYSTAKTPEGPWKYGGVVMPPEGGSFTNHPGVVDFRGKTYLFYHNGALPGGGGFTRSVCVKELRFNPDGSIPQHTMTKDITQGLSTLNPYAKNEGETIAWSEGMKTMENNEVGVFVKATKDRSYTMVKGVDFGQTGASKFTARLATPHNNVTMEVRVGGLDGQLLGTVRVPRTGGTHKWALQTITISPIKDIHDVYFIFKGRGIGELAYFDYWMFGK